MIAIDTNVLLRYLLQDDPDKAAKAAQLIAKNTCVLVIDVVLVEALWTLKGKKYRLGTADLVKVVLALLQEPHISFEDSQVIWQALNDFRKAAASNGKGADFADALIANKAKYTAKLRSANLSGTYTFDNAAQQLPGMMAVV